MMIQFQLYNFIFISVKKNVKEHNPMESRPKRKFISARDQEQLK